MKFYDDEWVEDRESDIVDDDDEEELDRERRLFELEKAFILMKDYAQKEMVPLLNRWDAFSVFLSLVH